MCDLSGPFKLCTCSGDIDYNNPHWTLKRNGLDTGEMSYVIGSMNPLNLTDKIEQSKMLRRLNTVNVFDFDYNPMENDKLNLVVEEQRHEFIFQNGKWKHEELLGEKPIIEHTSELKGYFEVSTFN